MSGILALLASAAAFAPAAEVWIGREPARTFRTHHRAQATLAHQPGWVEFTQGEGAGWKARFDERTGTAHRMWGPGIVLGSVKGEHEVRVAMERFLLRNRAIIGVAAGELPFSRARYVARTDTWLVDFDRLLGGHPVWRGGVTARIRFGKLIMLGVDTYPDAVLPQAELSKADAIDIAALDGAAPMANHTGVSATLVALPLDGPDGPRMHLAWQVRSETSLPRGLWVTFVDAVAGGILSVHNEVRFLDGTVYGSHRARTYDSAMVTSPMPRVAIEGEGSVNADEYGRYSTTGASASTWLNGTYLDVKNANGAEGRLDFAEADPTWTTDDATQAEIASYVYIHQVKDWAYALAPEVTMSSVPLTSNVNSTDYSCNAYYDGNLNFFAAGDGCNNTGEIADVNYHEWGHGFHAYSAGTWSVDGTIGEGAGDVVSTLMTHDSEIAPFFVTNGSGIRDVAPNQVYPDDLAGEVHYDGLIFGGAVWDVWAELLTTYGESREDSGAAYDVVAHLFVDALKANPTLETAYDEFIAADDDDADLANGTPHYCEIAEGFAPHGLGPLASDGGGLTVDHLPVENQSGGAGISATGTIVNVAAACQAFTLDAVTLNWSTDDGANWSSSGGTVGGDSFTVEFPEIPTDTIVHYYLSATGAGGEQVEAPAGGDIAPFTFYVGPLTELWCADLTGDDGALVHELIDGDEREGADDWTHGTPTAMANDPDTAFTGRKVWGNDLGGGQYNGEYQPNIHNRISTPSIDAAGHDTLVVQYRRWLNVEDGYYDRARVLGNGETIWENHASNEQRGDEDTLDDQWILASHRAAPTVGALTLSWEIESDGGKELGGWNLDDICVYAPPARVDDTGDPAVDDSKDDADTDDGVFLSPGGCGCESGGKRLPGMLLALAVTTLLVGARRR